MNVTLTWGDALVIAAMIVVIVFLMGRIRL